MRTFGWSLAVTALGLFVALILGGPAAVVTIAILAVLEISLSFDNAVVNATVLGRMTARWQRVFLTVGIAIAVFGMRLVVPLLIVAVTARLSPVAVVDLAVRHGDLYGQKLEAAQPLIAAFGGMFLLLLFLNFIFSEHDEVWLGRLERMLRAIGRFQHVPLIVACVTVAMIGLYLTGEPEVEAGLLGIVAYLLVNGLGEYFCDRDPSLRLCEPGGDRPRVSGRAAFFLFLYLEVLDASFSFDGVIGAFAISSNLLVIAAGLGIGAMFIRSLTVYLVRKNTLAEYVYLEHGAHWAIGALAVTMLVSVKTPVPEEISGGVGLVFIGAALLSSIVRNRRFRLEPG
ncbi:MAG TPA: DUF475 domain-containing protein [Streptosporangiaceae bacterium]|nr:DUF475 domain-containing protein [Streptosporangiaceae bacterium]